MKKQTLTVALLAVASLGWGTLAQAQGPEGGKMRRPQGHMGPGFGHEGAKGPHVGMMAERLGLSDDQKAQWKAIHERERENMAPLLKAAGEAREAFQKALESENADSATLGQAALNMRNTRRQLEAAHKATFESVKAILTPEQLAKVEEMEKNGRHRGPEGFGHRGPEGQGRRKNPPQGRES